MMKHNITFSIILLLSFSSFCQIGIKNGVEKSTFFYQNFDQTFVPEGWSLITNNDDATWYQGNPEDNFSIINPDNINSAIIDIANSGQTQNEWLISPSLLIPENAISSFYVYFNWSKLPVGGSGNPGATIQFMISENDGQTWQTIWNANNTPQFQGYQWRKRSSDLSSYAGQYIKMAWVVTGSDGGVFALDDVLINVSYDDDITISPTFPFDGIFNFVKIPLSQIESLNIKLGQYFSQITPELSFYQSKIINNGYNVAQNAILTVKLNGSLLGATPPIYIEPGTESAIVGVPSLLNFEIGQNLVEYIISMEAEDMYPQDNYSYSYREVTENIYALDSVNNFNIGYDEEGIVGNLFAIPTNSHVLNGLSFAFSNESNIGERFKVSLYFYQNADNIFYGTDPSLSLPFFTYEFEKTQEMIGQFGDVLIPSIRFPQFGTYLVMIEPVNTESSNICYDESDVLIYSIEDEIVTTHSGYGALACRLKIEEIPSSTCTSTISSMQAVNNCNGDMILSWDSDAFGYKVDILYYLNGALVSDSKITTKKSLDIDDLIEGVEYSWTVVPFNDDGVCGAPGVGESFFYTETFSPVTNLTANVLYETVNLNWTAPNQVGITGYEIFKDNQYYTTVESNSSVFPNDYGISLYGVKALYNGICSSEMVSIEVDAICNMPENLTIDVTKPNTADLQWSSPNNEAMFLVYRDSELLTGEPLIEDHYLDNNVEAGEHIYSVSAYYEINDCESQSLSSTIKVVDGINDVEKGIAIYPNPATDLLKIKGDCIVNVDIFTLTGNIMFSSIVHNGRIDIDVYSYPAGLYLVKMICSDGHSIVKKISIR